MLAISEVWQASNRIFWAFARTFQHYSILNSARKKALLGKHTFSCFHLFIHVKTIRLSKQYCCWWASFGLWVTCCWPLNYNLKDHHWVESTPLILLTKAKVTGLSKSRICSRQEKIYYWHSEWPKEAMLDIFWNSLILHDKQSIRPCRTNMISF